MFQPDSYISALLTLLKKAFRERLLYVGLQGSYLRGEATEHSDIDIMVVIEAMTVADLDAYRQAIASLPDAQKSCGFICGKEELLHWNPLEICHLLHSTKDYYGMLADLVPTYTRHDVTAFVQLSLGNLYHEICHRYIHAPAEQNIAALPGTYKQVFFILQNLHFLETGSFIGTKKELLAVLSGQDRQVLEASVALGSGRSFAFEEAFVLLYSWCREALVRTSSIAGTSL
ncbi:MAG: nucleotidyltransferase domain-containing protein [Clostridia bacterium]|nr:nucleotidyltransferase domain-containing protein [Clostridia bacterium]